MMNDERGEESEDKNCCARSERGRKQGQPFEVMLEKWQRGEEVSWGDLFASWVRAPIAPRSRETVRKVIRKVEWMR